MISEEKKAIEFLKSDKKMLEENYSFGKEAKIRIANDIEKALNLIEKQQTEYSDLKLKYEQGLLLHKKHVQDLEKKDKEIAELKERIADLEASLFEAEEWLEVL